MTEQASRVALYANVGPELTHYDVDVDAATLTRRDSVILPANVQYVWPHASRKFLYVATSDSASGMGAAGNTHHVSAFRIDPASGALSPHGAPIPLPARPIHMATDVPSRNILVAFNNPGAVRIYRINPDGTAGAEVTQSPNVNPGIFPHQVLASLDNRLIILVARGHDADGARPEEPGALMVFRNNDGVLEDQAIVAPEGGYGFGPRHLDFHPTRPWIYVSLERQNAVDMFVRNGDALEASPRFRVNTLSGPANPAHRQVVGTVHVHPNGRFVYVANRAADTVDFNGRKVFVGGENSIAVFAIDPATGQPTVIQHADTNGIHPRTFHIDPTGRLMVVAHIMGLPVRVGDTVEQVPMRLSLFRIADDGKLDFVRSYDVDANGRTMWWMGMVGL